MTDSQQDQAMRARELLAAALEADPVWLARQRGITVSIDPVAGDVAVLARLVHNAQQAAMEKANEDDAPMCQRELDEVAVRVVLAAISAQQPALPAGGEASDMAAFGASDAACYYYPGEDQQKERTAFCAGAVHHHAPIREDALREAAATLQVEAERLRTPAGRYQAEWHKEDADMVAGELDRRATAILALADSPTVAVPTVPREPTEVMIEAGARAYDFPSAFMGGGSQQGKQTAARVWAAMEASRIRALSPNEASDGEGK